jgi:hypothetical protein
MADMIDWTTLPAAQRRARCFRPLERAVRNGEIPIYQLGNRRRVRWSDVLRWIEAQRVAATPHAVARVDEVLARERVAS